MGCMCGHSEDNHEYPGGACSGCSHCQYYEADGHLGEDDYAALNGLIPGAGDYWRDNQRRVW